MQIGEAIAINVAAPDPKDPCWCCKEEKPAKPTPNDLAEAPNSVGEAENDLYNDASALGKNLGGRPTWQVTVPDPDASNQEKITAPVTPAAHHLIPGNASLKKAVKLLKCIEKSKGQISEDIGYDVNSAENGVWLPGSYGVKLDSVFAVKWSKYLFQNDYTFAAMEAAKAQFHDAHPVYSDRVLHTLERLADKIKLKAPDNCGICNAKIADKARPPYGLVGRLHRVSGEHKKMLEGPEKNWKAAEGYFTSSSVKTKLLQALQPK